jgi:carbon monoxide dehydrogenase subunit G
VSTLLDAPPELVWADVQDISSHVEWMADAETIRITSNQTRGAGTTFDCDTKVGPIRLTDKMAITAWEPNRMMGVRHEGVVTGTGQFTLTPEGEGQTRFTWEEDLVFPWWLAGRLGASAGRPVLRAVWRRNLTKLQQRFA